MDMQEGNRPTAYMAQMELVERKTTDAGKGSKDIAARIGHSIGVHTAVGESTAVNAFAVYLVVLCQFIDNSPDKGGIGIVLTSGIPSSCISSEYGEINLLALWISNDEFRRVGNFVEVRALILTTTISSVHGDNQWSPCLAARWHIESVRTLFTTYGDIDRFVDCLNALCIVVGHVICLSNLYRSIDGVVITSTAIDSQILDVFDITTTPVNIF